MSPGKLVDEKDVGCQDESGPGKIHEVILVIICFISDLDLRELKGSRLKGHELRFREFCVLTFVILQFWTARKLVPVK